eukprot:gnl/Chilomastix_cuspidata/7376.p2 GENE.gnl/Chilomastix_cuspidata/7376~~gnl/Chilomastix_cuspidata/7376.p2  ORF type:complete len:174 (-),score=14.81 gnl/Chilomastix_cuspidata/7376:1919-2440(-)
MENDFILVGKVSGAHGLKGALNVYSFAEGTDIYKPGSKLYLKNTRSGELMFFETVGASRKKKNIILLSLKGLDGRDKAEACKGWEVYVEKAYLPDTEDDSWYWHDLIGMRVVEENGSDLGEVKDLMRTGSSDILEVIGEEKEILIPFLKDIIISVSVDSKTIKVRLPEGLAEI